MPGIEHVPEVLSGRVGFRHDREEELTARKARQEPRRDVGSPRAARDERLHQPVDELGPMPRVAVLVAERRMAAKGGVDLAEEAGGMGRARMRERVRAPGRDADVAGHRAGRAEMWHVEGDGLDAGELRPERRRASRGDLADAIRGRVESDAAAPRVVLVLTSGQERFPHERAAVERVPEPALRAAPADPPGGKLAAGEHGFDELPVARVQPDGRHPRHFVVHRPCGAGVRWVAPPCEAHAPHRREGEV